MIKLDKKTYPEIWDTVDYSKKNKPIIICTSHSNDPVLYGIRGSTPEILKTSVDYIISENIEKKCIFKTNQSTDSHVVNIRTF